MTGAASALRGFRLQILYTLYRLLRPGALLRAIFQPEGVEDLAIFDLDGHLLEAVQIKAHSSALTLSELGISKPDGMIRRISDLVEQHPEALLRLVSFGPIGVELARGCKEPGLDRKNLVEKLIRKAGIPYSVAQKIPEHLILDEVDTTVLETEVFSFLKANPMLVGQAQPAFDLLALWLYRASEQQMQITHTDFMVRLSSIGRYLSEREAHHREWFTTIRPIESETPSKARQERLRHEFKEGIAVQYDHIVLGLDVLRNCWLNEIEAAFLQESVVIIHGASGQGKSALAYRFLHDRIPDPIRFQVLELRDRQHALTVATALSGYAAAMGVPITVYLDVRPTDSSWPELVAALSHLEDIRILVTVREEDWRRSSLSGAEIRFAEIALTLNEVEAREIYRELPRITSHPQFLSFEEAWRRFDRSGPLMEFVYLVNRTESLRSRLQSQIYAVRDAVRIGSRPHEELRVLILSAFASSLGARLDLIRLKQHLQAIDLGRTVELLEQEYLVRRSDDRRFVEGLHPIRSQIISELLLDNSLEPVEEIADECIFLLPEEDMETFLLHLFSRQRSATAIILTRLRQWQPSTWQGCAGVLRALLWLGIRDYVDSNAALIREAQVQIRDAWLILDFDLAGIGGESGTAVIHQLDFLPPEKKAILQLMLKRQRPKAETFRPAKQWLQSITTTPAQPVSEMEWAALAEVGYWMGRLATGLPVACQIESLLLNDALQHLPLPLLSDLVAVYYELNPKTANLWLATNRKRILTRYCQEKQVAWVEDDGETVRAHFLVNLELITSTDKSNEEAEIINQERRNTLHEAALQHIRLLRRLFPERVGYSCQGYGHRIYPLLTDDTCKTSIKKSHLPLAWALNINTIALGLVDLHTRPMNWDDYIDAIWIRRKWSKEILFQLHSALKKYFSSKQNHRKPLGNEINSKKWDAVRADLLKIPLLPITAVDEWGFITDYDRENTNLTRSLLITRFATSTYRRLIRSQHDFISAIHNFFNQSPLYFLINPAERSSDRQLTRQFGDAWLETKGARRVEPHLPLLNLAEAWAALPKFQKAFYHHFSGFFSRSEILNQDKIESRLFLEIFALWHAYMTHPYVYWNDPICRAVANFRSTLFPIREALDGLHLIIDSRPAVLKIINETYFWKEQPALWLTLECSSANTILAANTELQPALSKIIDDVPLHSLRYYALNHFWNHLLVIPQMRGKAIDKEAWTFPAHSFTSTTSYQKTSWLNAVRHPIPTELWKQLNLKQWQDPRLEFGQSLISASAKTQIMLEYTKDALQAFNGQADFFVKKKFIENLKTIFTDLLQRNIEATKNTLGLIDSLAWEDSQQYNEITAISKQIESRWKILINDFSNDNILIEKITLLQEQAVLGMLESISIHGILIDKIIEQNLCNSLTSS